MPDNTFIRSEAVYPKTHLLEKDSNTGILSGLTPGLCGPEVVIICLFPLFFLILPFSLSAQPSQEIYNQAVDRLNFGTMQFVLADDTQKPEAGKLAARLAGLNYNTDSLTREIIKVYGVNSRTQDLSEKINGYKSTFSTRKPIEKQLNQVIGFITEDRKKKSYLPRLQDKLEAIRKEAIELADENGQVINVSALQANAGTQQAAFPDLLSLAVIIIGIISLANLWLYYQLTKRRQHSSGEKDDYYKTVRQSVDFEIYPRLEKNNENLEKKIENLRQEVLSMLRENRPQSHEPLPEKPVHIVPQKPLIEPKAAEYKPVQPLTVSQVNTPKVVNFQVSKPASPEVPRPVKKYADYPKENGFVISQLQDISDRRSIYEITIPANSEQATFTVVDNKDLHEYAIQNRERLLKDACDFEISSSQHTKIEVLKPGKLLKNGNSWQISEKAKIKFV